MMSYETSQLLQYRLDIDGVDKADFGLALDCLLAQPALVLGRIRSLVRSCAI
jgi:hypothetical protein